MSLPNKNVIDLLKDVLDALKSSGPTRPEGHYGIYCCDKCDDMEDEIEKWNKMISDLQDYITSLYDFSSEDESS